MDCRKCHPYQIKKVSNPYLACGPFPKEEIIELTPLSDRSLGLVEQVFIRLDSKTEQFIREIPNVELKVFLLLPNFSSEPLFLANVDLTQLAKNSGTWAINRGPVSAILDPDVGFAISVNQSLCSRKLKIFLTASSSNLK